MRKMLILAMLLLPTAAFAVEPGTEAMPFLRLDFSPASLAMGASGPKTAATLPFSRSDFSAGASYLRFAPELSPVTYISGGAAGKYEEFGFSLDFTRGAGEKIYGTDDIPTDLVVKGGVGFTFNENYSAGVNLGYAQQSIMANYKTSSYVADFFAAGHFDGLVAWAGFSTLGSSVGSEKTGEFPLPSSITVGGSLTAVETEHHLLRMNLAGDYYFSGTIALSAGAEYSFAQHAFLRAGYRYGGDSVVPSFASAGLGLRFCGVELNAAYLFASDVLGKSLAIGLVFTM
ncbi:MAG: hypothetical protein J5771_01025 [Bacteroidales bacterium]|nr:hypothetical protein [Bacteroidales bacterium]